MTNLAEKRSRECNRDQITIGMNWNQIESNGGHANEKGQTIQARERIPSKQKNEKQSISKGAIHVQGCEVRMEKKVQEVTSRSSQRKREERTNTTSTWTASLGARAISTEEQKGIKTKREIEYNSHPNNRIQWKQKEACCTARVC
jgi:hypothetical protein